MADLMVDACGEVCPMPVIKIKKALQDMSSGQILEVTVDYHPSKENIQRFVISEGNEVLQVDEEGDLIKILVKKA
ncbi:MAG: sulfurtransferase TusA family protein [Spirochaetota bacterium]|nr:sulfurtransferase TusA family protein [Spirochaetota bacterium]